MVKKMVFAAAALASTAGSLFALTNKAPEQAAASANCAPACCDNGAGCDSSGCGQGGDDCCD